LKVFIIKSKYSGFVKISIHSTVVKVKKWIWFLFSLLILGVGIDIFMFCTRGSSQETGANKVGVSRFGKIASRAIFRLIPVTTRVKIFDFETQRPQGIS
jgi:hypothetical protein